MNNAGLYNAHFVYLHHVVLYPRLLFEHWFFFKLTFMFPSLYHCVDSFELVISSVPHNLTQSMLSSSGRRHRSRSLFSSPNLVIDCTGDPPLLRSSSTIIATVTGSDRRRQVSGRQLEATERASLDSDDAAYVGIPLSGNHSSRPAHHRQITNHDDVLSAACQKAPTDGKGAPAADDTDTDTPSMIKWSEVSI